MAPVSLFDITIPPFIANLKIASSLLDKAIEHDPSKEEAFCRTRLINDMPSLVSHVQHISDRAKGVVARVTETEPVSMEDNEKTFADLQERIKKTIEVLQKLDPTVMDGMEDRQIVVDGRKFTGSSYILGFAIPDFYYHFCLLYALLKREGVPIGKNDYLGI